MVTLDVSDTKNGGAKSLRGVDRWEVSCQDRQRNTKVSKIFYSVEQAARKLELSVRQVESMISSEKLPVISVGNRRVIPANAVDSLNKKGAYSAKSPASSGESRSSERPQTSLDSQSKDYYTDVEVAQRLNKPYTEVYRMANLGQLPVTFVDDKRVFPRQAIDHLAAKKALPENAVSKPDQRDRVKASSRSQHNRVRKSQERVTSRSPKTAAGKPPESQASRNEYFTPEQIAHALQRTAKDVDRMIGWGEIKTTTIEGRLWVSKNEVEKIISKRLKSRQDKIRKRLPKLGKVFTQSAEKQGSDNKRESIPEPVGSEDRPPSPTEYMGKLKKQIKDLEDDKGEVEGWLEETEVKHREEREKNEQLTRDLENLRKQMDAAIEDLHLRIEGLNSDLEKERALRAEAEKLAQNVTPPFEEEGSDFLSDLRSNVRSLLGRPTESEQISQLEDMVKALKIKLQTDAAYLENELKREREAWEQDRRDARYERDYLEAELENLRRDGEAQVARIEQGKDRRVQELYSELEQLGDLRAALNRSEATRKAAEKALSLEKQKVLRMGADIDTLKKIRQLLGAAPERQMDISETLSSPPSSLAEVEESPIEKGLEPLVIKAYSGETVIFRPPFRLELRWVELIQLVAGEDGISADQIKTRVNRRAVDDLDALLDRLYDEVELEPIVKDKDVYHFDPNFLQNTDNY